MIKILGKFVAAAVLGYILYINGFLVVNFKAAVYYKGSLPYGKGKNRKRAEFASCSGTIKQVIRLKKGKTYNFAFSKKLTKGDVTVEIGTGRKGTVLRFDRDGQTATLFTEEGIRYRLTARFKKATGEYTLSWDER